MIELSTDTLVDIPRLTGATLEEDSQNLSTLTLVFAGGPPDWVEYMASVVLRHHGKVLFCGKITQIDDSNQANAITTTVTVSNLLWLFQTTNVELLQELAKMNYEESGSQYLGYSGLFDVYGWGENYQSANTGALLGATVACDGWIWTDSEDSGVQGSISYSGGVTGVASWSSVSGKSLVSMWRLISNAGGAVWIHVDYAPDVTDRKCKVMDVLDWDDLVEKFGYLEWDTRERVVLNADLCPQDEQQITGIAVIVNYDAEACGCWSTVDDGTYVFVHPAGADPTDPNILTLTMTWACNTGLSNGLPNAMTIGQFLYNSVFKELYPNRSRLYHAGTVTVRAAQLDESPLCHVLHLSGPGAQEAWPTMNAPVRQVKWDFATGNVVLTMGLDAGVINVSGPASATVDDADKVSAATGGGGGGGSKSASGSGSGSESGSESLGTACWDETVYETIDESEGSGASGGSGGEGSGSAGSGSSGGSGSGGGGSSGGSKSGSASSAGSQSCACQCAITLADIEAAIATALASVTVAWTMTCNGELTDYGQIKLTTTATLTADSLAAETGNDYEDA